MDDKHIKTTIRSYREARRISQIEMAERLGIDRNTYRNIEHGRTRLLSVHLPRIAQELGVSVDELCLGYRVGDPDSDPSLNLLREEYEHRMSKAVSGYKQQSLEAAMQTQESTLQATRLPQSQTTW